MTKYVRDSHFSELVFGTEVSQCSLVFVLVVREFCWLSVDHSLSHSLVSEQQSFHGHVKKALCSVSIVNTVVWGCWLQLLA